MRKGIFVLAALPNTKLAVPSLLGSSRRSGPRYEDATGGRRALSGKPVRGNFDFWTDMDNGRKTSLVDLVWSGALLEGESGQDKG